MAHIDPIYAKDVRANYSAHGQARKRLAITQRCILIDMLQVLIKAKAAVTSILEIVRVNQRSGEQLYQAPLGTAPASPSLAERMINSFQTVTRPPSLLQEARHWSALGAADPIPGPSANMANGQ
jgi:hypothetical protein